VIKKENTGVRRLEGRAAQSLAEHRDEIQAYENLAEEVGVEHEQVGPRRGQRPAEVVLGEPIELPDQRVAGL
jgi:hypothetical protein